jgi:hypothetical protein
MAHAVTLMTASRPCSIFGSGTLSQRMSLLPCQVSAFIEGAPLVNVLTQNIGIAGGSYSVGALN